MVLATLRKQNPATGMARILHSAALSLLGLTLSCLCCLLISAGLLVEQPLKLALHPILSAPLLEALCQGVQQQHPEHWQLSPWFSICEADSGAARGPTGPETPKGSSCD